MFCPQCGEVAIPGPLRPIEGSGPGTKALWRRVVGWMTRNRTRSLSQGVEAVSLAPDAPTGYRTHSEAALEPMSNDPRI